MIKAERAERQHQQDEYFEPLFAGVHAWIEAYIGEEKTLRSPRIFSRWRSAMSFRSCGRRHPYALRPFHTSGKEQRYAA